MQDSLKLSRSQKIKPYTGAQRMQIRTLVLLASEIIAPYYPMRTFVHHNPLHGLEDFHFEKAVRRGHQLLGGSGYLSNETYRAYFQSGRILSRHIDAALKPLARDQPIVLGDRSVTHLELLRACLLDGTTAPARNLTSGQPQGAAPTGDPSGRLICPGSLDPMIKWCEAFLDEGHAPWPMPGRENGFYAAWKSLAAQEWSPCGIADSQQKIACLPTSPEDALIEHLVALDIPSEAWQESLAQQLADLPGWAGFIKWRADQADYEWQKVYPADLVQYLAVRLWYCRGGVTGPVVGAGLVGAQYQGRHEACPDWRLSAIAHALSINPDCSIKTSPEEMKVLRGWIAAFPESLHGPIWLKAFEAGYQEDLIRKLGSNLSRAYPDIGPPQGGAPTIRPQAQAVFCIDVRSESLRRHLEAVGDYDTFGFAGFFIVFIQYQAMDSHHATDQFPVIMKTKNLVREVPRTYQNQFLARHQAGTKLLHAGHELLYDLKENMITPYIAVESLGWFFSLPLIGKTLFGPWYQKGSKRLRQIFAPPIATALTVDKLLREEVAQMLAAEQRATIRKALQEQFGNRHLNLSLERLEFLRKWALDERLTDQNAPKGSLSSDEEAALIDLLRTQYRINTGWAFARMERITRMGFTPNEQSFTVETALRMMGLTSNFARIVLFCGHGSTSENNPFEAALDCGACGGNTGKPNARVFAAMANKPHVRETLAKNGLVIPQDTYFISGQHDTTTDTIEFFDLEDIPHTHLNDLLRLRRDLKEAGHRNSQERSTRFPDVTTPLTPAKAVRETRRRSSDWSQVRPEWGLSANTAFIVGHRDLTCGMDLGGRVFLHSYDYREDPTGQLLSIVMTGPQVVAQWINMEHYFSTVDTEVYGSGSKIYHNVVGRFGVMSGPQSDLRTGLARQTVMNGDKPYHEPMRLLTLIEAPRERIDQIIRSHRLLQHLYDNEWVHLVVLDAADKAFYRYAPGMTTGEQWVKIGLK